MPGWKPLVICNSTQFPEPCTFGHFVELIKNGIHDMVLLSTLVVVALLVWVGFKLLTSGGNEKAWTESKAMLWKVVIGYIWILAAWLVVYTITSALLNQGFSLLGAPTPN